MRTDGLPEEAIWNLGEAVVGAVSGRLIRARGDVVARHIRASRLGVWSLEIGPDVPPPRHARVIGWPPVAERDVRKNLAQQLRAEAKLGVRNLPD